MFVIYKDNLFMRALAQPRNAKLYHMHFLLHSDAQFVTILEPGIVIAYNVASDIHPQDLECLGIDGHKQYYVKC